MEPKYFSFIKHKEIFSIFTKIHCLMMMTWYISVISRKWEAILNFLSYIDIHDITGLGVRGIGGAQPNWGDNSLLFVEKFLGINHWLGSEAVCDI